MNRLLKMIMPTISKLFATCFGLWLFSRNFLRYHILLMPGLFLLSSPLFSQTPAIILDSVSVNPDNSIIIGWTLNTLIDDGYIEVHRRLDNGLYALITKVPMPLTSFTDTGVDAQNKAFSYYVVAYDASNNVIGNVDNVAHQTVYLYDLKTDVCGRLINTNWSNYALTTTVGQPVPLPSPFQQGEIFISWNSGPFQRVSAFDGVIEESSLQADKSGSYCIFIRALDPVNNITSTSNTRCVNLNIPSGPEYVYISRVGVTETSSAARISIFADNLVPQPAYVLKRYSASENEFVVIDTLETTEDVFEYTDPEARINEQSELYRVVALDSCRHVSVVSDNVASIFLAVQSTSASVSQLEWNAYEGWPSGVQEYIVQRRTNNLSDFEDVTSLPGSFNSYTDELFGLDPALLQGDIYYRILAVENAGNPYGFKETTSSNTALVDRDIEVFIPNAFNPDSQIEANRYFKPVFTAFMPLRYSMGIYNRWSERIYYTEQLTDAWDGSSSAGSAPAGVYSYVITFEDNSGNKKEKRGTLLLIR
jgi:hypothetical protein